MKIGNIGEDSLLIRLKRRFPKTIEDISDDCALIASEGKLLVSSDMLVEGTHFSIPPFDHFHIGTKAALSNISDILSTGGKARHLSICIGIPPSTHVEEIERLYNGLEFACKRHGCTIIGGDTCRAERLTIAITVLGSCKKPIRRDGASPGDILLITGKPGTSAVGLEALLNGYPTPLFFEHIERHLAPTLRENFALRVAEENLATAMMDISDGLIADATRLSAASGVSVEIDAERLPDLNLTSEQLQWLRKKEIFYILNGGEEYELMLTVPPDRLEETLKVAEETETPVSIVGSIKKGSGVYLISKGKRRPAVHMGFSHFQEERDA